MEGMPGDAAEYEEIIVSRRPQNGWFTALMSPFSSSSLVVIRRVPTRLLLLALLHLLPLHLLLLDHPLMWLSESESHVSLSVIPQQSLPIGSHQ